MEVITAEVSDISFMPDPAAHSEKSALIRSFMIAAAALPVSYVSGRMPLPS